MGDVVDFMRNCIVIDRYSSGFLLTYWDEAGNSVIVHDAATHDIAISAAEEWHLKVFDRSAT